MSSITFEINEQVAFITLNRPDKLNSFDREMALTLLGRLDECASLHEVRAVLITGAGRAFSAGQDLAEIVGSNAGGGGGIGGGRSGGGTGGGGRSGGGTGGGGTGGGGTGGGGSIGGDTSGGGSIGGDTSGGGTGGGGSIGGAIGMDKILSEQYNPIVTRIRNLPKPVVAAVNGVAAGAGANLALCCDIVVAARSASFIQAFSKIGLIPDTGGTWFLPRLVGWQKAMGIAMMGDKIGATEAERLGMVYKVFEDDEFFGASRTLAAVLAEMPTRALAFTKHAFNYSATNSLEAQLLLEDELQQKAALTRDHKEGINAFLDKRAPLFTGE